MKEGFRLNKLKKWWRRWIIRDPWDIPLLLLILLLLALGLVMLFSASFPSAMYETGDSFYYIRRQIIFVGGGLAVMWAVSHVDYHYLYKLSRLMMLAAIIALAVVLVPEVGDLRNNARRWIVFHGISFQPSELAKLAVIAEFSASASTRSLRDMNTFRYGVVPFALWYALLIPLMMMEPHLSGTVILVVTGAAIMYAGGLGYKYVVGGLAFGGGVIWGLVSGWIPYGQDRIAMWKDPFIDATGDGYQLAQSLITIGSGGLFGIGLGKSRQKFLYLPEESNDFIFSVICEEVGLVGAALILLVFAMLIIRGYKAARYAPDRMGSLLAVGITTQVAIQTFFNVAVVTGLLPTTGISLPFFSYGGSAMLFLMIEMGILLSITRVINARQNDLGKEHKNEPVR